MAGGKASWPPLPRRAPAVAAAIAAIVAAVLLVLLIAGCTTHSYLYRPVPAEMIPAEPEPPKVQAEELQCLSDAAYERLALRDRLLRQHVAELRALLGADDAHPDR